MWKERTSKVVAGREERYASKSESVVISLTRDMIAVVVGVSNRGSDVVLIVVGLLDIVLPWLSGVTGAETYQAEVDWGFYQENSEQFEVPVVRLQLIIVWYVLVKPYL